MAKWFKSINWRIVISSTVAIVFGFLTFVLLILDRSSSAAVSAAMTAASMVALFLPIVDTIEAFGLKAKLTKKIDESEKILQKIRRTAFTLTKPIFLQAAYGNRWGGIPKKDQQNYIQEVEGMLREMNISEDDIASAREPVLRMHCFDMFQILRGAIRELIQEKIRSEDEKWKNSSQGKTVIENDSAHLSHLEKRKKLHSLMPSEETPDVNKLKEIDTLLSHTIDLAELNVEDTKIFAPLVDNISSHVKNCWRTQHVSPEGDEFIHQFQHPNSFLKSAKEANLGWDASYFDEKTT